jgi:hypothetical protein
MRKWVGVLIFGLTLLPATSWVLVPARGDAIYRYGFGGKSVVWVRGDANVAVEVKEHNISDQSFKSQPTSEHLRLVAGAATGDSAFIHYSYETPPAPVTDALFAGVWVKATKPGVQLRAQVVLPKEPHPHRPETPLTMLIVGDTYTKTRQWQKLTLTDVSQLVAKHLQVLQTKYGRALNSSGAFIDRLVLNVYTGPGSADIWIDDLDIGPVKPLEPAAASTTGTSTKLVETVARTRSRVAEYHLGELRVDNKPFFFRAIRHSGTPLYVLRQAGFDALWLPAEVGPEVLAEANREGWLVIPSAPLAPTSNDTAAIHAAREALHHYYRKFASTNVLFWDLGGGRVAEQDFAVERTKNVIREFDPKRPFGADVWDGLQTYSTFLDVVGTHRWPLFTSLELSTYRDWLKQRNELTSRRALFWTWIQNHLPDWYIRTVLEQQPADPFTQPVGPQPEQVRLLAYIAIACNCRGLGFWSDRFLADSHHGRARLQGLAILNSELEMLAPLLTAPRDRDPQWLPTSDPNVQAACLRTSRGTILLPIWMGSGSQYVPEQGALNSLKVVVPLVEDGADPWRLTPAGAECLRQHVRKVTGGTELTIHEFDMVTPIVFTNDQNPHGLVAWWQDYNRKYGKLAARWALDMAAEQYEKTLTIHTQLTELGVSVRGADKLFETAAKYHEDARRHFAHELYDKAFADAHRALRPLRVIMRDHWNQATATLDIPTASPYAVSYFSLPKHWRLAREVQTARPAANVLPGGAFEFTGVIPPEGIPVDQLPGWSARYGTLPSDRVDVAAGIVPATQLEDAPEVKQPLPEPKMFAPSRPIRRLGDNYVPPQPELGRGVLKLEVRPRIETDRHGQPLPLRTHPLERTFLAVESPVVRLPPGSLVRISGWVKIDGTINLTADGALFYDDIGGEPLGVRLTSTANRWKKYHLYRRVPASGVMSLTVALTGAGVAYFDDLRIEPLIPVAPTGAPNTVARPTSPPLQPAGGRP